MTLGLIEHWKLQFLIPFPLLSTDRNQNSILNHPGSTPSAGDIWYCAHPIRQFEWPHLSALERQYNQRHPCCCYPLSHPTSFSRPHPIINPICWVKIQSAPNPLLPSQWVTKTTQHFLFVFIRVIVWKFPGMLIQICSVFIACREKRVAPILCLYRNWCYVSALQ